MLLSRDQDEDYYRILACPIDAERKLQIKKSIIDVALSGLSGVRNAFPTIRDRRVGIAFDEWNISGCHTLTDALGIARMLNALQRQSAWLRIGGFFPLIHRQGSQEGGYSSPITVYEDTIVCEAGYHAFDLYINHTGTVVVDSYVESETYDLEFEPRVKVWNAWADRAFGTRLFTEIPYLDTSATLGMDGKTLYLATVNAHRDTAQECLIELRGCIPAETGHILELSAGDVFTANDRTNQNAVTISEKAAIGVKKQFRYSFPPHSVTVIEIPLT